MKLPVSEYQRQATPSAGGTPPMARDVGMGGVLDAARSMQIAANERQQVADQQLQNFLKQEHEQAKARNTERVASARLQWAQSMLDRQAKADPEASNFTGSLLGDFDKWAEQSGQSIKDEDERRMFKGMLGGVRDHLMSGGLSFEAGARRGYRKQVIADGIDTDSRTAMADPGQTLDVLAARLAAINASADLDAETKGALAAKARETITFNAGAVLVERDPAGWLKRDARTDPLTSRMDPSHIQRLNAHAQALVKQREAANKTEQDRLTENARKKVEELREFTLTGGVVSPQYEAEVLAATSIIPGFAEAANQLVSMSRSGAGFGALPLNRQAEMLTDFTPGDPEQAKLKAHMQMVYDRQQTAYKENPWAAAEQYGRLPKTGVQAPASVEQLPAYVAQQMRQLGQVETMAGGAQSPIRPEHVPVIQQQLAALPVERRADMLASLGQILSPEHVSKVAEQLDKGDRPTALMMLAAGDRTTAGVALAVRIGQGAQALKDKAVKVENDPQAQGWRTEISNKIRGLIGDGAAEDQAIDAAFYVRAAMAREGYGFDASNEAAVKLVVGNIYAKDGMKTPLPRGMDDDAFTAKLKAYTPEKLSGMSPKFFVGGQEYPTGWVAARLGAMGMKRYQGQYVPFYNGVPVTTDKEGQQLLRLDMR